MDEEIKNESENKVTDPTASFETPQDPAKGVGKGAYGNIDRSISDKDLKNPVVGRLLLDERDRLLGEKIILEGYRDKYYDAERRAAVALESAKGNSKFTLLYTLGTGAGGVLIGAAFSVDGGVAWALGCGGAILMLGTFILAYKQ